MKIVMIAYLVIVILFIVPVYRNIKKAYDDKPYATVLAATLTYAYLVHAALLFWLIFD